MEYIPQYTNNNFGKFEYYVLGLADSYHNYFDNYFIH